MKVVSKFLTADVRITGVRLEVGRVVVEGMVKEFMPMTVEMSVGDVRPFVRALVEPLRDRLAKHLPERFARAVRVAPE